jgi:hypothetical protein
MVSRILKVIAILSAVCIFAMLAPSYFKAAALPECPQLLKVSQTAQSVPEDWTQVPFVGTQRLVRITFRLSVDPGELRPDDERDVQGERVFIWNVEGMNHLEQVCEYSGTLARLVRPVPGDVRRCEVKVNNATPGALRVSARCY